MSVAFTLVKYLQARLEPMRVLAFKVLHSNYTLFYGIGLITAIKSFVVQAPGDN